MCDVDDIDYAEYVLHAEAALVKLAQPRAVAEPRAELRRLPGPTAVEA
jgi:hypothetical protein